MHSRDLITCDNLPLIPAIPFQICPIEIILEVLGKKWALLILRDIGLLQIRRFNHIIRSLPGLTPRVLTLRLHELEENGFIEADIIREKPRTVEWKLTTKGQDTLPILLEVIAFGIKWYPDEIFGDCRERSLQEVYPFGQLPKSNSNVS